jgi:hypothetical protein
MVDVSCRSLPSSLTTEASACVRTETSLPRPAARRLEGDVGEIRGGAEIADAKLA